MGLNGVTGLNGGATGMSWNGGGVAEWTCTDSGDWGSGGGAYTGTGVCEPGTKLVISACTNSPAHRGYPNTIITFSDDATAIVKCWGAGGG